MSKTTKVWLIAAASLVALGLMVFAAVMTVNHWDFTLLGTAKYETNAYQVSEDFDNIDIKADTADILFAPSDDGMCRVVCYEPRNERHNVSVQDDTLSINVVDKREWYEYIGITLGSPKITVYLPKDKYGVALIDENTGDVEIPEAFGFESIDISTSTGDVKNRASASQGIIIKTNTGDIRIENISANTLDLSVSTGDVIASSITCEDGIIVDVSTGDIRLSDVQCRYVLSTGGTGDIALKNTVAAEKLSLERSTGDIIFEKSDAAELFVKTSTGSVTGSLLTDKIFVVETGTGSVALPKTTTGGKCEIVTNTGSVRIDISSQ